MGSPIARRRPPHSNGIRFRRLQENGPVQPCTVDMSPARVPPANPQSRRKQHRQGSGRSRGDQESGHEPDQCPLELCPAFRQPPQTDRVPTLRHQAFHQKAAIPHARLPTSRMSSNDLSAGCSDLPDLRSRRVWRQGERKHCCCPLFCSGEIAVRVAKRLELFMQWVRTGERVLPRQSEIVAVPGYPKGLITSSVQGHVIIPPFVRSFGQG